MVFGRRLTRLGGNHRESPGKDVEVVGPIYGHVMRREEHYVGRRAMEMKVQGRRKRRRAEKMVGQSKI